MGEIGHFPPVGGRVNRVRFVNVIVISLAGPPDGEDDQYVPRKLNGMKLRCIINMVWLLIAITVAALAGCSSAHNLNTDGSNPWGGGFRDQEIKPGFYRLTATGNVTIWPSFGAAIGTWRGRADQLCGTNAYQEIVEGQSEGYRGNLQSYIYKYGTVDLPKYNTSIWGYILCNASGTTPEEAVNYLNEIEAANIQAQIARTKEELEELEKLGGSGCNVSDASTTAENFLRRGKILSSIEDYQSAMKCFMQIQEMGKDTNIYRESCSAIGLMYELGQGVEKDLPEAKRWYKKAGL
ncbi:MAG: hypothetical protein ACHP7O_04705 [Burkholderiales bacterium]